ncbi:LPS-assembly protein LptD [Bradyrhizobium sp. WBOS7]|uniref:LPS-assembly protein LptD n=1 Tax=Bradyrhizobium betae TaxID=244734 RepID=A0AAE9NFC0_9BRAD|nr:LPS-assembly protein LptD [Bradyrhizobium sp. WBOS2]MDD1570135.1 LPS-assembly protein LptD [Bradyrhizobium sp. WBOS1]MDD1576755.1 LPS-assembly protein LptD [Bradyrhizobium sp. WBOS7]MDD1599067.1 LPS-assembly protein LptD [Bradyrhizobium sp. WBOS16]UUO36718.1 LPS-assembly protein LptD [Bradyrhizobium sp. WBOS01]UUO43021.1 LPS-assembly protein LptD [Bradyrhizobium sp. WBOS02]UUO54025.1 LPS-assembly protein LptD [Bradyrhizobium sp. WBOS07]UUO68030.1 LPS-assembly protein LptD [Bradyrhizobium 
MVARCSGRPHRLFGLALPGGRLVSAVQRGLVSRLTRRILVRADGRGLSRLLLAVVTAASLGGLIDVAAVTPASAQYTYNPLPPRPKPPKAPNDNQMLVQATEVDYDYNNSRVSAVGNVQLFYNGTSVEADRVIYDQKTKRLHAEGNIRMTDADGKITYAEIMDLSDDYRDGFVDSLRADTADQTRMAASRADRSSGNYTVFENGVYTACAPCRDDPKKPPLWQVKGARIIHDQQEKMLYFETAQIEFFGVPLAYMPYFSTPDPTVKRKSGFLMPGYFPGTANTGFGAEVPYYWAIAPDMDATFTPRFMTRQGVMLQGEFRQRLIDGAYQIRAYGINQLDPGAFSGQPGDRDFRGAVDTKGQFALNDKWVWGWDGVLMSDYYFFSDYRLYQYRDPLGSFLLLPTEALSQLYLTGVGNRSFFDARTMYWLSYSGNQSQVPIVYPVIDYSNVLNYPVFGGEVSYKTNFVNLSRDQAVFDPITTTANTSSLCTTASADPLARMPSQCLLRGFAGTYTRLTAEAQWRKSFTDPFGQIWTPFASLRADAINSSVSNQPGVSNYLPVGDTQAFRLMPTVGLEYRYPFINIQPWGSTTVEPIAQIIIRPNETYAGRLPNEDAQSLVFDASNLFSVDKFSGYDRVEGGGRANVGVQSTTQFDRGGAVKVLFGQSYQLFGLNSFAVNDAMNTGLNSGLDKPRSDYVASTSYSPNSTYTFSVRSRMDEQTWNVQRFEAEGRANFNRWAVSVIYGNYAAQPELGYLARREGILTTGSLKVATNWVVSGSARWDLEANKINQYVLGAGYVDDCFVLAANYVTSYSYAAGTAPPTLSHAFMFQIGLRTLATSSASSSSAGLQ